MLFFKQIFVDGYDKNFSYLIGSTENNECLVVDPWNSDDLIKIAQDDGMKITKIIATHKHFDHTGEINLMHDLTNAKILIHEKDSPHVMLHSFHDLIPLKDEDIIKIGDINIKVIHTPGHSEGSICLYIEENNQNPKLITGDTLFIGSCGRVDLPGGDIDKMYRSLFEIISNLPENTDIYPGHDYGKKPFDSLENQKKENRYLRLNSKEEFVKLRG